VIAAVTGLPLAVTDPDLMRERLRHRGQRAGLPFLPIILWLWSVNLRSGLAVELGR
jgi:hypothetical protein